jgi:hypothetical protein
MHSHGSLGRAEDDCIHEQITLKARQGVKVPIGIYEDALPPPKIDIEILPVPQSGEVKESILKRSTGIGDHQLIYYFQNFSDQEYTITLDERCE